MIPNFKTYINETYWSDMNKRAQGTRVRKEDNVNLMDAWQFNDYLGKIYIAEPDDFDDETGDSISYYVSENIGCTLGEINDNIYVGINANEKDEPELFKKIRNNFKVIYIDKDNVPGEESYYDIEPKDDRNVDFKFFITVLDFLIDNIKKEERYIWRR